MLGGTASAINVDGDFVECGVNRGGFARSLLDLVEFAKREKKHCRRQFRGVRCRSFVRQA